MHGEILHLVAFTRRLGKVLAGRDDPQPCRRNARAGTQGASIHDSEDRMRRRAGLERDRARDTPVRCGITYLKTGQADGPHARVAVQYAGLAPDVAELQLVVDGAGGAGAFNRRLDFSAGSAATHHRGPRSRGCRRDQGGCREQDRPASQSGTDSEPPAITQRQFHDGSSLVGLPRRIAGPP